MSKLKGISDLDLGGKRVLIRVDYNVPLTDGSVDDDTRIRATLPTLQKIMQAGASIMLMSHLGRPEEGQFEQAYSLAPVARCLSSLLDREVPLIRNWTNGVEIKPGDVLMLENVRFESGEKKDDDALARKMAELCDVFVNDAFATSHRAHASTHGVAKYAPLACAGPLLMREIEALGQAFENPAKPMTAIVGGSKVSTKLTVLESLMDKIDELIIGGGIANTFLKASGYNIGNSLFEENLVPAATSLLAMAEKQGKTIPMPVDVVCAKEFSKRAPAQCKTVSDIESDDLIMDVGPETAKIYASILQRSKTIVWNGPLGVFEFDQFGHGTEALANAIAESNAFSVAGGGDTLSAIAKYGVSEYISYISTGGGAFLEFLEGKKLPSIAILETRQSQE
jgi:phosphoglycerate kinase